MITISNLTKTFGSFKALNDVSVEFQPGKITAILGSNGSGKTTLMKTILGLVQPDRGDLLFDGSPLLRDPLLRSRIGYMPQTGRFPDNLKIPDLVKLIAHLRGATADAGELYQYFDLVPHLNKPIGTLSGGMRQKLSAVLAFVFDADVIILDEPTAGLDPGSAIKLKKLIIREKGKGKTIIFTSHIIHVVEEIADEIVFLLEGVVYYNGTVHAMNTLLLFFFNSAGVLCLLAAGIMLLPVIFARSQHVLPFDNRVLIRLSLIYFTLYLLFHLFVILPGIAQLLFSLRILLVAFSIVTEEGLKGYCKQCFIAGWISPNSHT